MASTIGKPLDISDLQLSLGPLELVKQKPRVASVRNQGNMLAGQTRQHGRYFRHLEFSSARVSIEQELAFRHGVHAEVNEHAGVWVKLSAFVKPLLDVRLAGIRPVEPLHIRRVKLEPIDQEVPHPFAVVVGHRYPVFSFVHRNHEGIGRRVERAAFKCDRFQRLPVGNETKQGYDWGQRVICADLHHGSRCGRLSQ